jgi:hypothetical protein
MHISLEPMVIKDEKRIEPIPSNGEELVRLNRRPCGPQPVRISFIVFIGMLIAGIFQGYDIQALAHTAVAFSKEPGMTPTALAPASTAGLFGTMGSAHCSSSIMGRGSGPAGHDHLHLPWNSRGL